MNRPAFIGLIVATVLILLIAGGAFYVVSETEQVVITQFGKPVGQVTSPGLKIKIPFIQQVHSFDKRFLEWDGSPNNVPTRDKRFIWVDSYARWQITDPLLFFQRMRDERGAQSRIDDILDGETRNTVAKHDLIELVRSTNREFALAEDLDEERPEQIDLIRFGRDQLRNEVLAAARTRTSDLGIEILDFRFKRIDYVEEVRREVYARMISERQRIAERFRSEGAGEAARISGQRDRELQSIESEAYRTAQEIRGRAEGESTRIYSQAYGRDPDFYRFLKSMETLRDSLDEDTVLVLSTEGELLRYLERSR
jgi:modulator of FtsH protease HflC